jgi:thioredoxin-like negative regulator of GroEL
MPVYELTTNNMEKVVPDIKQGTCVVLHYMNGCIHCEMFMPIWKKVCQYYTNKNEYMLMSVEYGKMKDLPATMQNVQGFPTLRAYKDAKPIADFNDDRSYEAVKTFIEEYGKNGKAQAKAKPAAKTAAKAKAKPAAKKTKKKETK